MTGVQTCALPICEGLTGYNVYVNDNLVATLGADATAYDLSNSEAGEMVVYVTSLYGNSECNMSSHLTLEELGESEEIFYEKPTFGDITYVNEENYQITYEMYWHAPETDKEVSGYLLHYNYWPLNTEAIAETTYRCTLRKMMNDISFGVCAVYADGKTSDYDYKSYNLDDLLTDILQTAKGKTICMYGNQVCVDGSVIRSVEIFNLSGHKVHEQKFSDGINLIKLSEGTYVIRAVTDQGIQTQKISVR